MVRLYSPKKVMCGLSDVDTFLERGCCQLFRYGKMMIFKLTNKWSQCLMLIISSLELK